VKHFLIYFVSILILIASSCSPLATKKNGKKSAEFKSQFQIELKGRNDFLAKIKIDTNSLHSKKKNVNIRVKLSSKSKFVIDTTLKGKSLALIYPQLMPILMKAPYESPISADFKFENKKFEALEPIEGSKIDTSLLLSFLKKTKIKDNLSIDLEKRKFYMKPLYTSDSEEAKDGKLALEKCLKSVITLNFEGQNFKMDKEIFATWLHLDSTMKVKVETDQMQTYLQKIAKEIETPLSEILESFEKNDTTAMEEVVFSRLNINNEINEIVKLIPKGSKSTHELLMTNRGLPKGVRAGHQDFVEVSIAEQKLWLFKGGNLLLETDVVTGNKKHGRSTPQGSYSIQYKARNKVLRGRDYESFVSYWMPFHSGYGLHDANWRRKFGASIYESRGSHGCVNIPSKLAPIVYNNVKIGTPVIIW